MSYSTLADCYVYRGCGCAFAGEVVSGHSRCELESPKETGANFFIPILSDVLQKAKDLTLLKSSTISFVLLTVMLLITH